MSGWLLRFCTPPAPMILEKLNTLAGLGAPPFAAYSFRVAVIAKGCCSQVYIVPVRRRYFGKCVMQVLVPESSEVSVIGAFFGDQAMMTHS